MKMRMSEYVQMQVLTLEICADAKMCMFAYARM